MAIGHRAVLRTGWPYVRHIVRYGGGVSKNGTEVVSKNSSTEYGTNNNNNAPPPEIFGRYAPERKSHSMLLTSSKACFSGLGGRGGGVLAPALTSGMSLMIV